MAIAPAKEQSSYATLSVEKTAFWEQLVDLTHPLFGKLRAGSAWDDEEEDFQFGLCRLNEFPCLE